MVPSRHAAIFACLLLAACGTVDFEDAPEGRFEGSLLVMWVGEGGASGDGRFVYVPSRTRPLTFHRDRPDAVPMQIQPEMMYTDGGSIPRAAQLFNGFSPWGYAPAYMVHDWLFVARHCLTDGMATDEEQKIAGMEFQDSAEIIAEAIKTLVASGKVQNNDIAPRVISGAVAGPISYHRWVVRGACAGDRVSAQHREEVEATLARQAGLRALRPDVSPATIVAEIDF